MSTRSLATGLLLSLPLVGCEAAASAGGPPTSDVDSAGVAVDHGAPVTDRVRFPRPDSLRGLFVSPNTSLSPERLDRLFALARTTEINALVIDVKRESGHVSHDSGVPRAREVGAVDPRRVIDMKAFLDRVEAEGLYPIARIVIVKDSLLGRAHPELAVQDTAGGVWVDSRGQVWLNLHQRAVWRYAVDLAEEAARMGFPEIQWDYVRFPDGRPSDMDRAHFPGDAEATRTETVRAFLAYARQRLDALDLDVHMTADVFGAIINFRRIASIGQEWERVVDLVDAVHPMIYPSHYSEGWFGVDDPNAYPYEIVLGALEAAAERNTGIDGAGEVRPWLQAFDQGEPEYGAAEVRAQIQATYDAGFTGWILWNHSSVYPAGALRPNEGFSQEPRVRVGGEVVPVPEREAARERGAARRRALADSVAPMGR
ncbi:MAG: putative glycoside hydrolase [Gemmatimonadota bacterium]